VVDACPEKHIPVISVTGNTVTVSVGSVEHPMAEERSILWVYLQNLLGIPSISRYFNLHYP
jgi:superoxide reductase